MSESEVRDQNISGSMSALATAMVDTDSLQEFLREVVALAVEATDVISCGITMSQPDGVLTVASSGPLANGADEVQYGAGTGPCLDALRSGHRAYVPELALEDRWPAYCAHVRSLGVRSSLSLPLHVRGEAVAALNLYSDRRDGFEGPEQRRAGDFADQATAAISMSLRYASQVTLTEQLRTAMESRSVIDQAMGSIMTTRRCTAEEAFALLRSASQRRNVPLRDVARELTAALPQCGQHTTSGESGGHGCG